MLKALRIVPVSLVLASCTLPYEQLTLPGPLVSTPSDIKPASKSGADLGPGGSPGVARDRVYPGNGDFTTGSLPSKTADTSGSNSRPGATGAVAEASTGTQTSPASEVTKDGITLNLVGASVAEVAKTVLGDVLGVNYTVSEKVKSIITLRTANPVEKSGLLAIFESVLREEGAVIVVEGNLYKIVPAADAATTGAPLRNRKSGPQVGVATEIVPLRYVAAPEMERILKSAAPQASILRVDTARNLLMISGTKAELASMSDMIHVFDVDWMRGMSFAIYPIETSDPDAIAQELETIFSSTKEGPTKGIVRFIPNRRLKSVMVITSRPEYLKKAGAWLARIDLATQATEKQVYVYHVQHRPAAELAVLLQRVYQSRGGASVSTSSTSSRSIDNGASGASGGSAATVAGSAASNGGLAATGPSPQPLSATGGAGTGTSGGSTVGVSSGPGAGDSAPVTSNGGDVTAASVEGHSTSSGTAPPDDRAAGIQVIADEIKNSLVITATAAEYKRVKQVLYRIDTEGVQILLEATIAEVTLNDNLKFGVRWFFNRKDSTVTDGSSLLVGGLPTAVTAAAAGFQYFLNKTNLQVVMNALSAVTNVSVISSPSLMVAENKRATLQVGNEVPIITQQQQSTTAVSAIVNSVSYRSTGVILAITPRLSDDGKVFLEIEQEVSDAITTTSSTTTGSPTIQQRRVKTTVSVNDGETIVLAGLMQDKSTRDREQIPLLGTIPLIGNAFKTKDDKIERTELLISITPQVIRSRLQLDDVTAEYRDRLNLSTRPQFRAPPDHREDLDRIIR